MSVDAKMVDKALRSEVLGLLKEIGFTRRSGLKLWRHHEQFVDVIQFKHFSRYDAVVIGTETFSVAIELGLFLTNSPFTVKQEGDAALPYPYHCQFRGSLTKHLQQPELEVQSIWHVNSDGSNFSAVFADIRGVIERDAPAWFDRVRDLDAMRILVENENEEWVGNIPKLWGFGRPGSRSRVETLQMIDDLLAKKVNIIKT